MISMKNDRIIASWGKIEPSDSANERMLTAILERNRSIRNEKDKVNYMSKTKKTLISVAACLALLIAVTGIVGVNMNWFGTKTDAGAGIDGTVLLGGSMPEGIDPVVASVAVYPADKSLSDIVDATLNEITKEEAYSVEGLSEHLPTVVIDGYQFRNASLYETSMKDGSKYFLLRIDYTTGNRNTVDYSVQLTNFEPKTDDTILTPDTIPSSVSDYFHFEQSGIYYGMDPGDLTYEEIMAVINSIE